MLSALVFVRQLRKGQTELKATTTRRAG